MRMRRRSWKMRTNNRNDKKVPLSLRLYCVTRSTPLLIKNSVTPKLTPFCTVNDTAMKKLWKAENPSDTLVRKRHRPICCSVDGQKRYVVSMEHRREGEAIPFTHRTSTRAAR